MAREAVDETGRVKLGHQAAPNITEPEQQRKIFIGGLTLSSE